MTLRQFIDRYGVALGVILGLVVVVAALPGNATDRVSAGGDEGSYAATDDGSGGTDGGTDGTAGSEVVSGADGGTTTGGTTGGTSGGSTGGTTGGRTGNSGQSAVQFGTGPSCGPDGKQKGISFLMPPCVQWTGSDNGGATANGVTGDKIRVIRWLGQIDPATRAILQGASLSDAPAKVKTIYDALRVYSNQHYETYGREVVYEDYAASGESTNDEAMKRDAINIAAKKPFAVMVGDPAAAMPTTLVKALAQRNIICICSVSMPEAFYSSLPPVIYSSLPSIDQYARHSAEYIAKRLLGKKAIYAGDDYNRTQGFKDKVRKFGLIYITGQKGVDDEWADKAKDVFLAELAKRGISISKDAQVGYNYNPGRNQQDVTTLIAKLKNQGVTTIIPIWDPLYPILITTEATNQLYFPEWFMVGTGLSDTTTAGRLYDQKQWEHAFGISPLWVTWQTVAKSAGSREYHHGAPGRPAGDEGVLINIYRAYPQTLFRGIHMAGPNLTNESFFRGQLAFPHTGGKAAAPLHFYTRENPTEIKDFMEVFYATNASGPDERGRQGNGMIMKVNGGRRYLLGQWPTTPPKVFVLDGAISVTDNPSGGGDYPHEQDGHTHKTACVSCAK